MIKTVQYGLLVINIAFRLPIKTMDVLVNLIDDRVKHYANKRFCPLNDDFFFYTAALYTEPANGSTHIFYYCVLHNLIWLEENKWES